MGFRVCRRCIGFIGVSEFSRVLRGVLAEVLLLLVGELAVVFLFAARPAQVRVGFFGPFGLFQAQIWCFGFFAPNPKVGLIWLERFQPLPNLDLSACRFLSSVFDVLCPSANVPLP